MIVEVALMIDCCRVMQAWLFHSAFWNHDRAKALLTSVPQVSVLTGTVDISGLNIVSSF